MQFDTDFLDNYLLTYSQSVSQSVCLSVYLSVCLSVCCLSVCLSVCESASQSVNQSVCCQSVNVSLISVFLYLTCLQVTDPGNDFFTDEVVAFFADGSSTATAVLTVVNDLIPENNETFVWRIVNSGLAQIGTRPSIEVVIRASDQPQGVLQFAMVTDTSLTLHMCIASNLRSCMWGHALF